MSLPILRFKYLLMLSACMLNAPIYADTTSTQVPYCRGEQLAIHQIAVDSPGMMKTRSLYGIINTSEKSCRLNGTPAVWGISNNQKIYLSKDAQQNAQDVILEPAAQNSISSDKLVWFSMKGSGAIGGTPFKTIHIILPGISGHVYTVKYDGYNAIANSISTVQKNAASWDALKNDSCPGFTGKVWPIYFTKVVNCG